MVVLLLLVLSAGYAEITMNKKIDDELALRGLVLVKKPFFAEVSIQNRYMFSKKLLVQDNNGKILQGKVMMTPLGDTQFDFEDLL